MVASHLMSWSGVLGFAASVERAGLTVPPSISQALSLRDAVIDECASPAMPRLLDMSPAEAVAWARDMSARDVTNRFEEGLRRFESILISELQADVAPELEDLSAEMRVAFEAVTAPFVAAVRAHGFTARTSTDDLLRAADYEALKAWRTTEQFYADVQPIAAVRVLMSTVFNLSPTVNEQGLASADALDFSVAFAAGGNWGEDREYYLQGRPGNPLDWFRLAADGIRLNSPTEVRAKLLGNLTESEG